MLQRKAAEVRARRSDLKKIEDLGAILEEHLILDNRYTEHRYVLSITNKIKRCRHVYSWG
jgi:hypothetical protein